MFYNISTGKRLLVIGEDQGALQAACDQLADTGYNVQRVNSGGDARQHLERHGSPHLVVIALPLPDIDGLGLCQELHEQAQLPIIALAKQGSADEAVRALRYVDDYIRQPVAADELVARIVRVLRRIADFSYAAGPELDLGGGLILYPILGELVVEGEVEKLTPTESALLQILATHRGQIVPSTILSQQVWNTELSDEIQNNLRVHIHRLRRKLQRDPDAPLPITTKHAVGYALRESDE